MFLFSKNERLILECVYVKYLRSLRSHVYRFISKITKQNSQERESRWGEGQPWTGLEAAREHQGTCVSCREEPNPTHPHLDDTRHETGLPSAVP